MIPYNFHVSQNNIVFFNFFKPLKNVKIILTSQAIQKQARQIWFGDYSLSTPGPVNNTTNDDDGDDGNNNFHLLISYFVASTISIFSPVFPNKPYILEQSIFQMRKQTKRLFWSMSQTY